MASPGTPIVHVKQAAMVVIFHDYNVPIITMQWYVIITLHHYDHYDHYEHYELWWYIHQQWTVNTISTMAPTEPQLPTCEPVGHLFPAHRKQAGPSGQLFSSHRSKGARSSASAGGSWWQVAGDDRSLVIWGRYGESNGWWWLRMVLIAFNCDFCFHGSETVENVFSMCAENDGWWLLMMVP